MDPFGGGATSHRSTSLPPRSHFQSKRSRKDGARINVAAHRNEMTIRIRAKKTQATDFRETECCPPAVFQREAWRKNDRMRGKPGVTGTLGKANSHFEASQMGSGTTPTR